MLMMYGLYPALKSLSDSLEERANGSCPDIQFDLPESNHRYPPGIEEHLYQIVKQGCENALHHAQAKTLIFKGELREKEVDLLLEDDGVGFELQALPSLAEQQRFGVVGMVERAELIGARLQIDSAPGAGTRLRVRWHADQDD
jgi:signal transduction histidine kinase